MCDFAHTNAMPITEILKKNADFYPNDVSLVEINPQMENQVRMTWKEYSLIESNPNMAQAFFRNRS